MDSGWIHKACPTHQVLEIKWQRFGMKWFLILEGWYTVVLIAFEVNILSRFTLDSPLAESAMRFTLSKLHLRISLSTSH